VNLTNPSSKTCAIGLDHIMFTGLLDELREVSSVETFTSAGKLLEHYADDDSLPELILIGPNLEPETVYAWALKYKGLPVVFYLVPEPDDYDEQQIIKDIRVLFGKQTSSHNTILNLAQEIQEKLLPDALPDIAGYELDVAIEQQGPVGGDFYWFHQSDETLILSVGDVSGKGISAAMLVGFTQELFESVEHLSLKTMRRLNRQLCLKTPDEVSVACTIVEIELATGRFKFCNAGNPPLVALGLDRRKWEHHQPSLGWLLDYPFQVFKGCLAPGELLALFSDGISEDTVLETLLPTDGLSGWAANFLSSTRAQDHDDRVLLAIRRGQAQKSAFDWKYALDSVLSRLDRIKPQKLFSYTRAEKIPSATPTGGFMDLPEDSELILARYKRADFAQALIDHEVLAKEIPLEITTNKGQKKIGRSVTVRDRRSKDILLVLRGHLGAWTFENPVDEERMYVNAYLIDQVQIGEEIDEGNLHKFLLASLNENVDAFIALPESYDEARKFSERGFAFLDPITAGRYLALSRDLAGENVSQLLDTGGVMLMPDCKVVTWKIKEMILSENEMWSGYFANARYKKMRDSAHHLHKYKRIDQ
jgi:Stage II sporulation protein E (SpoIIE)